MPKLLIMDSVKVVYLLINTVGYFPGKPFSFDHYNTANVQLHLRLTTARKQCQLQYLVG